MPGDSGIPSDAELKILRQLWWGGELSVRELHDRVRPDWPVGYTTVLKLLQRMHDKGLVRRRRDGRAHIYRAVDDEAALERRIARDFLTRVFDGSIERLVSRALPEQTADAEEIAEIQRLLRRMDR